VPPLTLAELQTRPTDLVEAEWKPVRALLGIWGFGVNGYAARRAGDVVIEDHSEADSGFEELYIVLSGEITFTIEGDDGVDESFPMRTGQFIYAAPDRGRTAVAVSDDASILVVGGIPRKPFAISDWEQKRL
jgi:hypothetical protein